MITGATSGPGKAILEELASADLEISVIGRNKATLALIEKPGIKVFAGDVTDEILINNSQRIKASNQNQGINS